jgi:hypothetical protein
MSRELRWGYALDLQVHDAVNIEMALELAANHWRERGGDNFADAYLRTLAIVKGAERCEYVELSRAPPPSAEPRPEAAAERAQEDRP